MFSISGNKKLFDHGFFVKHGILNSLIPKKDFYPMVSLLILSSQVIEHFSKRYRGPFSWKDQTKTRVSLHFTFIEEVLEKTLRSLKRLSCPLPVTKPHEEVVNTLSISFCMFLCNK